MCKIPHVVAHGEVAKFRNTGLESRTIAFDSPLLFL